MEAKNIYEQRINRVFDYIREHLTEDLSLEALAQVAHFSPYHFHRLFKAITGETVKQCTNRLRLERAAALLKTSPTLSVTDAAFACGFQSASSFSRAFHQHFGITARAWDRLSPLKESKNREVLDGFHQYTVAELHEVGETAGFGVRVRDLPARWMACIRVVNSYQPHRVAAAYAQLLEWYRSRGGDPLRAQLIGMSQDDPDVTPLRLCRYDVCLTMPGDWTASGEVSAREFPACRAAIIHCAGDIYLVDRAWQYLYRYWLPRSGYVPDNLPALEIFRRQPADIGWEYYDLECAVPVVMVGMETSLEEA
ncbi:MAG: AraC family transcriptional regulator [Chloroflexi bacterium]|nr:AraC family transcriptional regulator [Chloroflexota bacterium]